ncbi:AraC family transcriptional regulator [Sphingopyxis sp. 22461]|uniref:AraC family transcriptional regulator n=1 Tax=Sphingopyxis sp. 22461 TaxID=3453923 RepID=UPI003F861419
MIEHFSTRDVASGERLAYWNRIAATQSAELMIDSRNREFRGDLGCWKLGRLAIMKARAEASVVSRQAVPYGDERLLVHLQTRGSSDQRQLGRECLLRPGDLSICTTAAPMRIETVSHEMLVLKLLRSELERRVPQLDLHIGSPTPGNSPAVHSFHQLLLALWREAEIRTAPPSADWETDAETLLLDLLGLALRGAVRGGPNVDGRGLARVKAIVDARLGDPELDTALVAQEVGISPRTIQHWLAAEGTTLRAYVLEHRLERALDLLAADRRSSITAIAMELGFNDPAYFARCFRKRYGFSPSQGREVPRG